MKIIGVTDEVIEFDNGKTIWFDHNANCCEWNYADFKQIEDEIIGKEFIEPLEFESVEGAGFRFGNGNRMFFVPCYSEQNGYYSDEISIFYGPTRVLSFDCEVKYR